MINVIFVHHSLESGGGSERVIFDVMRGLDRSRFRPVLCCLYDLGKWGEQLRSMGYSTHANLMRSRYDARAIPRVARILKQEGADICYVTDGFLNMVVAMPAAAIAKSPIATLAFHSYDTVIRRHSSAWRRMMFKTVDSIYHPRFSSYIALAKTHKKYLVECKGLPSEKVFVVYNGVHIDEYSSDTDPDERRGELGLPADARVVVMVASLSKKKAQHVLLRAAAQLVPQAPDIHFLLAGDGPERHNLERLAVDLGIEDNVHLLGKVDDVASLLKASDLAVLSSEHEAFPLSLLEAMAAARPMVATDTGSVSEIVVDGVNGYLVEVGAVGQLANAMTQVLDSPDRGRALGQAGRRIVEEQFSIEACVSGYASAFEEWVASGPRRHSRGQEIR